MNILIFCLLPPLALLLLGGSLKIEAIPGILGLLVGVAGAIFTIMSIWVAFLYPNVLKTLRGENLLNADFSAGGEDTARLKEIVSVIIQSALVMIFSVSALLVTGVIESFPFKVQEYVTTTLQFLLVYFCGIQISALASTILINFNFIRILDKHRKKRAKDYDA